MTIKDLKDLVKTLNDKYCKRTKNHLIVHQAYGGYEVMLTGKEDKRCSKGNRYKRGSLGSGTAGIGNDYHDNANKTINGLKRADQKGYIKNTIKFYEGKKWN